MTTAPTSPTTPAGPAPSVPAVQPTAAPAADEPAATGGPTAAGEPAAVPVPVPDPTAGTAVPLTGAEAGIWFGQRLDQATPAFNTAERIELHGPLDVERFRAAVRAVMLDADAAHRRFVDTEGAGAAIGIPRGERAWPVDVVDLRDRDDPAAAATGWIDEQVARPLDLATGPLGRSVLLRLAGDRWWWFQQLHHIAADGYAALLLVRRIAAAYATGEPPRPFGSPATLLADDLAYRASGAPALDRDHWTAVLGGREPVGLAPGTALSSPRALRHTIRLDAKLLDAGAPAPAGEATGAAGAGGAAGRSRRRTWSDLVLAAAAAYVHRVTGAATVAIGLPVMNRTGPAALVPATVMNIVPLVVDVRGDERVGELADRVAAAIRTGRPHQRYRHEELRRDLVRYGPGRRLFDLTVNVLPFEQRLDMGDVTATVHNVVAGPVEDLTIDVRSSDGTLVVSIDANPAVHTDADVRAHLDRVAHVLRQLPADPLVADLDVVPPGERELVLHGWNATEHPVDPALTLVHLLRAQAARDPGAPALVTDERVVTFGELDRWSDAVAAELRDDGAGAGRTVGIGLPRSPELIAAIAGTLKAGAAYLPLELDYPAARLRDMVEDAQPAVVIVAHARRDEIVGPGTTVWTTVPRPRPTGAAATRAGPGDAPPGPAPGNTAYVIFTSGSTGRPKGVAVSHRAIVNRLLWMADRYGIGPGDRILHKTPIGFDVSVWELLLPLLTGAPMVIARPGGHQDPAYLCDAIVRHGVTTVHFVPSMLRAFLAALGAGDAAHLCGTLRRIVCSGEALTVDLAARCRELLDGVELHNLYGPTEAAVDVTEWEVTAADADVVPIGRPVWNTQTYVLDDRLRPVPVGRPGELYLAGVQIADGYVGRPDLTAERFLPDPFRPGDRMYRTGDLAAWRDDGALLYLGRADHQVKLRGRRIELGEIELALAGVPGVGAAAVLLREDRPGDQRLVAYLTPIVTDAGGAGAGVRGRSGTGARVALELPGDEQLRRHLAATLPDYMVPTAFVRLPALPLSPNGKLDRGALPAPGAAHTSAGRPPATPREELVCGVLARVLGVGQVAPDDGFFDLGGHSLLAIEATVQLADLLGIPVPVTALFQAPSAAQLLATLDAGDPGDGLGPVLDLRATGEEPPLWCVHPAGGLAWCYAGLLAHLPRSLPVLGLQADGLTTDGPAPGSATATTTGGRDTAAGHDAGAVIVGRPASIAEVAARYVTRIRARQPAGSYRLLGWSVGGTIAHEIAVQLQDAGEQVELLCLLDCYPSEQWVDAAEPSQAMALRALLHIAGIDPAEPGAPALERAPVIERLRAGRSALAHLDAATLDRIVSIVLGNSVLMKRHRHRPFRGDVLFVTAAAPRPETWLSRDGWQPHVHGRIVNHDLDCTHPAMVQADHLRDIAALVGTWLRPAGTSR